MFKQNDSLFNKGESVWRFRRIDKEGLKLFCVFLILVFAVIGRAENERTKTAFFSTIPTPETMVDPKPDKGDLTLPMPCGGKMVFRHVCVPVQNFFDDFDFSPGCLSCRSQEQNYMEGKRSESISGAFTLTDLPRAWSDYLYDKAMAGEGRCPSPEDKNAFGLYYFIGKYEVSTYQWETVMADGCSKINGPYNADTPRPKTMISWFDAIEFTRRYSEWLIQNAKDDLPIFTGGRFAYIRLPTEAEWEYAAKGGHQATNIQIKGQDFFDLQNGTYKDYAVFTSPHSPKNPENPAWIGSKRPNPLGLYDTAGNVAEMVLDTFRFAYDNQLHGPAGGFVIKGGSYRKSQEEIMPGRREEMPFFLENGAFKSRDLGFRVVLSAIVTPSDRKEMLESEWYDLNKIQRKMKAREAGETKESKIDPFSEMEYLAASIENKQDKAALANLQQYVVQSKKKLSLLTNTTVKHIILSAVFTAEAVRSYTMRRQLLLNEIKRLERIKAETATPMLKETFDIGITGAMETIGIYESEIGFLIKSYQERLDEIRTYPFPVFEQQMTALTKAVTELGTGSSRSLRRLSLFNRHAGMMYQRGEITREKIMEDILAESSR